MSSKKQTHTKKPSENKTKNPKKTILTQSQILQNYDDPEHLVYNRFQAVLLNEALQEYVQMIEKFYGNIFQNVGIRGSYMQYV